ncbi:unnamed protein product [Calypogeia fissa]
MAWADPMARSRQVRKFRIILDNSLSSRAVARGHRSVQNMQFGALCVSSAAIVCYMHWIRYLATQTVVPYDSAFRLGPQDRTHASIDCSSSVLASEEFDRLFRGS